MTIQRLAKITGFPVSQVHRDETGINRLTTDKIRGYAKAFGVDEADIIGLDNGTKPDVQPMQPSLEKMLPASFGPETVPLLGRSKLSSDKFDFAGGKIGTAPRHPNQVGAEEPVCVLMPNALMEPRYELGEPVYINKGYDPAAGKDCAIEFKNGNGDIKRFEGMDGKTLHCRQLNPPKKLKYSLLEIKAVHAVAGRG